MKLNDVMKLKIKFDTFDFEWYFQFEESFSFECGIIQMKNYFVNWIFTTEIDFHLKILIWIISNTEEEYPT